MLARRFRAPVAELLRVRVRALYVSPAVTLKAQANKAGHNRFGVVAGAAVDARSVVRHRLKRVVCAAMRAWPSSLSSDFVVILARPAARLSSGELRAELDRARDAAVQASRIT
ncbi:MAG: ribonuclease P protein component [Candidatus Liptonbacteria bacterium]|nr:ribonuclease P protein component [Candidatus Liptonbacteria bacterium]